MSLERWPAVVSIAFAAPAAYLANQSNIFLCFKYADHIVSAEIISAAATLDRSHPVLHSTSLQFTNILCCWSDLYLADTSHQDGLPLHLHEPHLPSSRCCYSPADVHGPTEGSAPGKQEQGTWGESRATSGSCRPRSSG